jgi:hypothetical protein
MQDRCTIYAERAIGSEIILEIVLISMQDRCTIYPIELLSDVGQVEAHLGPFREMLISTKDMCTVCVGCTTSREVFLGAPDGTPR